MVIKAKSLFLSFAVASAVILAVFSAINGFNVIATQAEAETKPKVQTVVIDAGHGGEDSGAVAEDGTLEKDINLDISIKLEKMLTACGFNVIMTRDKDISVYTDGDTTRTRKVSDMKNRLSVYNAENDNIVISIHQNKFTQSKYSGTQVFYSVTDEKSKTLAESIKTSVTSMLQPSNYRETKPADKNIYLLYNAKVPAVIVECGFLSNPQELSQLKDEQYRSKLAFSVFCGFLDYYNKTEC